MWNVKSFFSRFQQELKGSKLTNIPPEKQGNISKINIVS